MDERDREDVILHRNLERGLGKGADPPPSCPFQMKQYAFIALLFLSLATGVHAEEKRVAVPIGDSPSLGPVNAPVTIVEFIDFQ
jgi:hypothetical protein